MGRERVRLHARKRERERERERQSEREREGASRNESCGRGVEGNERASEQANEREGEVMEIKREKDPPRLAQATKFSARSLEISGKRSVHSEYVYLYMRRRPHGFIRPTHFS